MVRVSYEAFKMPGELVLYCELCGPSSTVMRRKHKRPSPMIDTASLAERLRACYTGAVHDVLRAKGYPAQSLLPHHGRKGHPKREAYDTEQCDERSGQHLHRSAVRVGRKAGGANNASQEDCAAFVVVTLIWPLLGCSIVRCSPAPANTSTTETQAHRDTETERKLIFRLEAAARNYTLFFYHGVQKSILVPMREENADHHSRS